MSFGYPYESKFRKKAEIKVSVCHKTTSRKEANDIRTCFSQMMRDLEIPRANYRIEITTL